MSLANTSFDSIKLKLKHVVDTLKRHLHMKERELVGYSRLFFSYPIRMQVDYFLSLHWPTCLPKLQKSVISMPLVIQCYKDPISQVSKPTKDGNLHRNVEQIVFGLISQFKG